MRRPWAATVGPTQRDAGLELFELRAAESLELTAESLEPKADSFVSLTLRNRSY
jgi:hypothetical protein